MGKGLDPNFAIIGTADSGKSAGASRLKAPSGGVYSKHVAHATSMGVTKDQVKPSGQVLFSLEVICLICISESMCFYNIYHNCHTAMYTIHY